MVVALSHNQVWEEALGRIGRRFAVRQRADGLEVLEGVVAPSIPAMAGRWRTCRPAGMENLGDASFTADHGLRYPCMSGAMANGIGSVEIVEAMGRAGFLGVFGAAGLPPAVVEQAIDRLQRDLGDSTPYAMNLIHSPGEPGAGGGGRRPLPRGGGSGWWRHRRS